MDDQPMMTLEGQRSSVLQEAAKMTFSVELLTADSTMDRNLILKDTSDSLPSVVDEPLKDQPQLELKNKGSLENINQVIPVLVSKGGPKISNRLMKEKTIKYIEHQIMSTPKSTSKLDLNGVYCEPDLQMDAETRFSYLSTPSDSPVINSVDVYSSNTSSTIYHFSNLTVRPISEPAYSYAPSPVGPSHLEHPYSAPLPATKGADLPRIIKHKPSSITFADYESILGRISNARANESSDAYETSSEDDGDDVFPKCKEFLQSSRQNGGGLEKQRRKGTCGQAHGEGSSSTKLPPTRSSSYEAEEESSSTEESPQVLSPWSESMTQLMKRLDQLNLDIEEALSAGSSPSDTPITARRHAANDRASLQWGAAGVNQTLNWNNMAKRPDTRERHGQERLAGATSSLGRSHGKKTEMSIKKRHGDAEIEAKEACDWLRAAGFPQYAQLFEDSQFPIDISPVKKDHDFLDKDLVEPLCRRLNTLNKCASMKLDVNLPKKKSEDSDEDDLFAISDKWTFEWSSRRWSRLQDINCLLRGVENKNPGENSALRTTTSSESILTDLSEPEISSLHSESSGGVRGHSAEDSDSSHHTCSDSAAMPDHTSLGVAHLSSELSSYGSLPVKHGKRGRTRAKEFLRRMEALQSRGAMGGGGNRSLVISAPVLQQEPEAVKTLRCVEIINGDMRLGDPPSGMGLPSQSSSEGSSSQSSGSAVSTPNMKERNIHRADHKRSGMYLEDLDVFSSLIQGKRVAEQNRRNEFRSYEDLVVHIPKDHKPGTFPKALSIESLSPSTATSINWHSASIDSDVQRPPSIKEARPVTQCCTRGSRISIYDNVPGSHLYASTGDLIDLEKEDLFPHLDDILQHVNGLQQIVDHWSKNVLPNSENAGKVRVNLVDERQGDLQSSSQITLDFEGQSVIEDQATPSDVERDGVSLNETETAGMRERRDSGVGASLTRPRRLRWPSFQISNRLSHSVASLQITSQSEAQLSLLQKFSLLRLTAIMEKYSMSNKHGWTWSVPKFMKRMKVPDYKDKNVFGVPLIVHVQRFGQPLPLGIQQALRYLRSQCLDQVGLFRKSGVKSRIQALRQMNENSPDDVNYEDQSAYDVADMVKQFFRDLPEPLLTSKLGETFLHIYQYVPKEQRLQAVQAAIMLMSDENREVLQTLLCFLSDVTSSVQENQMTPMNIAVCLAPSLFHLNILKKDNLAPKAMQMQKKYAAGRPDQKDLNENLAATQGLAHMITECNRLFEIPHEVVTQSRNSYVEAELQAPTIEELCKRQHQEEEGEDEGSWPAFMEARLQSLLKESREKAKGWVSCQSTGNTELSYKKVGDGNPLRRWRVSVEVEAPPSVVLNRVLRERHLWDVDLMNWKVCEGLDRQTEVFQYVLNCMPPHPSRDFVVLRSWRTDLPRGTCSLVSVSIEHEDCPPIGGIRAIVMESNYLLEPCGSGKSRLTHICRVDLKGRTPEWYNKAFGHLCAAEAARIRNSFQPIHTEGPETKI
ncbi:stAR-related lipid transfer protein 13 isoform X1 [Puntigrus tetrazona]|uniref:stAR-related lipid transfer protein 13 isoform X1 n=1 Tax=Puntigrus tetrazona TaxID=1606681 RepID=UPI001C8A4430|nr:stAR-related lipid transfer protein 13 isoform X1 [Puntigrus tetrazona]